MSNFIPEGEVYLRTGDDPLGEIVCTLDEYEDLVREGDDILGDKIVYFRETFLYDDDGFLSEPIAHLDGKIVRSGKGTWSDALRLTKPLCNIDGDFIREGEDSWNDILYTVHGEASDIEKAALAVAAFKLVVGSEVLDGPGKGPGPGPGPVPPPGPSGGGGGGGGCLALLFVCGLIAIVSMFSQCSWPSFTLFTVRQSTNTESPNPQPHVGPRPTPVMETPFPVITPIPVVHERPVYITAHRYDGTGKIYKVPELKLIVDTQLQNAWLYGDFCFWGQNGTVLRCHTVGVVLGVPQPGSTKVDIDFQGGLTVSPRVWDAVNHGLVARFTIQKSDPLELLSVTKVDGVFVVRCRTLDSYNTGP